MRILTLLALSLLTAGPALARTPASGGYSVSLEDEYGRSLQTWRHRGDTYVMGTWGQRYNVRVQNNSGTRIEAVVSVDGRDVVSGQAGDYVAQRGYIIAPYDSVVIEGFRQSNSTVASFRFTSPSDSYSARMGTPQNVGVVGVAVFQERQRRRARRAPMAKPKKAAAPSPPGTWWGKGASGGASDDLSAAESAPARDRASPRASRRAQPQNNIGTQYGETRHSAVVEVEFRRRNARRPNKMLQLYYDDASGLQAKGVPIYPPSPPYYSGPNPFPNRDYAPPPPRW